MLPQSDMVHYWEHIHSVTELFKCLTAPHSNQPPNSFPEQMKEQQFVRQEGNSEFLIPLSKGLLKVSSL